MISESKGQKRHRLSGHPDPDPFLASFEEPMSNIPRKLIPKLSSLCPPEWTVTMGTLIGVQLSGGKLFQLLRHEGFDKCYIA